MYEMIYPSHYRISSGRGFSRYKLVAFDNALIDAGISNFNLVRVSSILPSRCTRSKTIDLKQGSPLLTAYATISSNTPGEKIATAVAVGIPENPDDIGIIMEHEEAGTAKHAEATVRKMVEESMNNHRIKYSEIAVSSIDGIVREEGHLSLISAIVLW